jgi:hypothetical protein
MRKLAKVTGVCFLSLVFMLSVAPVPSGVSQPSSPSEQAQVLGEARLSLIQGDVAIQTEDTGSEWGAATMNMPLPPGTKIWDPEKGRAEIQFSGGSYLRASENTEVDITNLSMESNGDVIQVGAPQGRLYINYAGSEVQNSVFQVDTPITSIISYRHSKFQVDVYDGSTEVSVIRGSVYVQNQTGRIQVEEGSMLSLDSNQNAELSAVRPADAWISWNLSRDSALARAVDSRRYLPASLDVYSNDFDAYGRWVSTADYGYVWTPRVVVASWAPYRLGRWCWIGGDYVWVSYEPWGWAPYHYGRWAFIRNIGWCWVPPPATAVYWGPGYVAWINAPTYVSWVPLAPREIYYGYGHYGPWSVNIRNININRLNITHVYVNARVVNAVTVIGRQTFLTGRPGRIANVPRNPFTAGVRASAGRPRITPVRATALPNPVKTIPRSALPPRHLLTAATRIEHRPVGLHKNISVFHPGRQAPSMRVTRVAHPKAVSTVHKRQPQVNGKKIGPRKAPVSGSSGPPAHRQFGIAPQHSGQLSTPPAQRKELGPSPKITKPAPTVRRRETAPPSVQKRPTARPSVPSAHREFGVVPQHPGQLSTPPAQKKEMRPSPQTRKSAPPIVRRQSGPPARISRRALPVPKEPTGPSVQRNMGVAPPHVRQPAGSALPSRPRVVSPGTSRPGTKNKDKR